MLYPNAHYTLGSYDQEPDVTATKETLHCAELLNQWSQNVIRYWLECLKPIDLTKVICYLRKMTDLSRTYIFTNCCKSGALETNHSKLKDYTDELFHCYDAAHELLHKEWKKANSVTAAANIERYSDVLGFALRASLALMHNEGELWLKDLQESVDKTSKLIEELGRKNRKTEFFDSEAAVEEFEGSLSI